MNEANKTSTARVSRRVTATERFKSRAGRGRTHSVLWILLGIGGLFGAVVLVMFVGDDERPEVLAWKLEEMLTEARKLRAEGKLDPTLDRFRAALAYAVEHDVLNSRARHIRGEIKEVEREKGLRAEMELHIAAFEKDFRKRTPPDWTDLRRRVEGLLKGAPDDGRLREMHAALLREIQKDIDDHKEDDFQWTRKKIWKECSLDGKERPPDWGLAIQMWKSYQRRKTVAAEDRPKADDEIKGIEAKARIEFERMKNREKLDHLKKQRPRFEGTAVAAAFDALLIEPR